jgi:hypothetical protein
MENNQKQLTVRLLPRKPDTNYWTAVLGAALYQAQMLGQEQQKNLSDKAYRRLLCR